MINGNYKLIYIIWYIIVVKASLLDLPPLMYLTSALIIVDGMVKLLIINLLGWLFIENPN